MSERKGAPFDGARGGDGMTVGLFGGTFDPVHVGHLDVVRAARRALGLDLVWLVPAHTPPHRRLPQASAAHRFAMAALATQVETGVLVSDLEMEASGPSYTTATLDRLESQGWNLRSFCFVIGADAFREIEAWKDYPRVLDRCDFAVVSRPGMRVTELRNILPSLAERMVDATSENPSRPSILLVDAPTSPVSSTDVRSAIARGASLEGLLPVVVAEYIARHGLYKHAREGHESGKEPHEDTATPAS